MSIVGRYRPQNYQFCTLDAADEEAAIRDRDQHLLELLSKGHEIVEAPTGSWTGDPRLRW